MITKILHRIVSALRRRAGATHVSPGYQRHFEWQSEFLFVPSRPPLGYETPSRSMKGAPIVEAGQKANYRGR